MSLASSEQKINHRARAALYLNVPYGERTEAKAAGAHWDPDSKMWYIHRYTNETEYWKFERWMPIAVVGLLRIAKRDPHRNAIDNFNEKDMAVSAYYAYFHPNPDKWETIKHWKNHMSSSLTRIRLQIADEILNKPEFVINEQRLNKLSVQFTKSGFWCLLKASELNLSEMECDISEVHTLMHIRGTWQRKFDGEVDLNCSKALYYLNQVNDMMVNCVDIPERLKIKAEELPDHLWTQYEQISYDQVYEDSPIKFDRACENIDSVTGLPCTVTDIIASYLWPFLKLRSADGKTRLEPKKRQREEEKKEVEEIENPKKKKAKTNPQPWVHPDWFELED